MNLDEIQETIANAIAGERSATMHALFLLHSQEFKEMEPHDRAEAVLYATGNINDVTELNKMTGTAAMLSKWGYRIVKE